MSLPGIPEQMFYGDCRSGSSNGKRRRIRQSIRSRKTRSSKNLGLSTGNSRSSSRHVDPRDVQFEFNASDIQHPYAANGYEPGMSLYDQPSTVIPYEDNSSSSSGEESGQGFEIEVAGHSPITMPLQQGSVVNTPLSLRADRSEQHQSKHNSPHSSATMLPAGGTVNTPLSSRDRSGQHRSPHNSATTNEIRSLLQEQQTLLREIMKNQRDLEQKHVELEAKLSKIEQGLATPNTACDSLTSNECGVKRKRAISRTLSVSDFSSYCLLS